jgi:hypothetical protein
MARAWTVSPAPCQGSPALILIYFIKPDTTRFIRLSNRAARRCDGLCLLCRFSMTHSNASSRVLLLAWSRQKNKGHLRFDYSLHALHEPHSSVPPDVLVHRLCKANTVNGKQQCSRSLFVCLFVCLFPINAKTMERLLVD